ncbi:hypothetical protein V2J09_007889 [Rumex salicifolius]
MALEAVVYQKDLFGHYYDGNNKDLYTIQQNWSWNFNDSPNGDDLGISQEINNNGYLEYLETRQYDEDQAQDQDPWEVMPLPIAASFSNEWSTPSEYSSEGNVISSNDALIPPPPPPPPPPPLDQCAFATSSSRPKRRCVRTKKKNKEEIENQRMTHIAVERNRRKQMNDYLSILKSLMPNSYVQRSDQASIVGGAINYVKELEQNLHSLSTQKTPSLAFKEFFSFPQYSMMTDSHMEIRDERVYGEISGVADVEVTMIESHANLKIRSKKHPKQLLKLVTGLQNLKLSILHLNVSTMEKFALYSISVKVDDDSKLNSVDEIGSAVHQLLGRIHEEASLN